MAEVQRQKQKEWESRRGQRAAAQAKEGASAARARSDAPDASLAAALDRLEEASRVADDPHASARAKVLARRRAKEAGEEVKQLQRLAGARAQQAAQAARAKEQLRS